MITLTLNFCAYMQKKNQGLSDPPGRLRRAGALDGMGQADGLEHPDEIPADVRLIPAQAEARGAGVRVMILVPVLAPGRQLEGPEPPDVHAGVALFDFVEVREAVHQALHVQRVDEADGAHPEETHPAEAKNQANKDGKNNNRRFGPAPDLVDAGVEFRSPALLVGGMRLIEPAKMRPPKAALLRTGNVLGRVGDGVVQAMIRNPACRVAGAVEDGPEDQELLDELVGLDGFVGEHAVVADGGAEAAEGDAQYRHADDFEAGNREKDQTDDRKSMDQDEIGEDAFFAMDGFPKGAVPRTLLLRCGQFHVFSGDLLC